MTTEHSNLEQLADDAGRLAVVNALREEFTSFSRVDIDAALRIVGTGPIRDVLKEAAVKEQKPATIASFYRTQAEEALDEHVAELPPRSMVVYNSILRSGGTAALMVVEEDAMIQLCEYVQRLETELITFTSFVNTPGRKDKPIQFDLLRVLANAASKVLADAPV